ncbi:FAD-dependent oxidoreductase [Streptomyces sp. NPDC057638]|uniref:FAD-dependent oxidoreductase n=1 Tax=Streptomyces sp. NPDC057638 TaxID=3346190 RepID=UPI0036B0A88C
MSKQSPDSTTGKPDKAGNADTVGRRSVLGGAAAVAGAAALTTALPATAHAAPVANGGVGVANVATPDIINVAPADKRFPDLVRGTNQRWSANPGTVRLVTTPQQAQRAVQEAVDQNKRLTVRSGGHCYEDFVFNSEVQVVVDVSGMNQVYFDQGKNAFCIESGASNLQVYETLYKLYGVSIPAGSCASVGAGGHIVGGGFGLLSRLHGLTVDHLYGVEVVVVRNGTAQLVTATRDSTGPEKELWWAHTGGGGGNFGLITRYWMRSPNATGTNPSNLLPKPPSEVILHSAGWDWKDLNQASFTRLLQNFGNWCQANSAPGSPYESLFGLFKLNKRTANNGGRIILLTQMDANVPNAQQLFNNYLDAIGAGVGGPPTLAMTRSSGEHAAMPMLVQPQVFPWYIATDYLSGGNPTLCGDYKSAYARKPFSTVQIQAMYQQLTRNDYLNGDALVQIDTYGCQINTVASAATAVPQRDSIMKLQFQTYWAPGTPETEHVAWIRDFYKAVYAETQGVPVPNQINDGCYINYPDKDLNDPVQNPSGIPWSQLYYLGNYPRLQTAKQTWDPTNFFRHAQSVRLPGTT